MATTKINQKEYLKKYLSNDKDAATDKKKKTKKSKEHAVSKKKKLVL